MFPKSQLSIRWFQIIRQYITCLALEYITNLIIYSNQNNMGFTIGTLDYSVGMIPGWLVISLECTYICAWEKHLLPKFLLINSTLCQWTQNSPNQYHIFRILNLGRRYMRVWNYFSLIFGLFVSQIVTKEERTMFSTMPEWQRSPQSSHHLILITNDYYHHLAHHISRYGVHHIVTMKMETILILMIQIVVIQICWWSWVP